MAGTTGVSGYTPLFDSLVRGTLCGKWPDIGLWPVLLSMTDFRGEIDATQQYIATVTGLPLAEVTACLKRFCEPDPGSRSQDADGARLQLIDPNREWGWRVVNVQKYRDKASGKDQIQDGRNTEKVKRYRDRHRATPGDTGRHRLTPTHTHTHTHTHTKTKNSEARAPVDNFAPDPRAPLNERPLETVSEKRESKEALRKIRERIESPLEMVLR